MSISSNIKAIRKKYDLTQTELGKIAGVSDKAVCSWEKGLTEPRMGAVNRIANHFGIKISDLLEDKPEDVTYYLDPKAAQLAQKLLIIQNFKCFSMQMMTYKQLQF